jgi:hypothetical protein
MPPKAPRCFVYGLLFRCLRHSPAAQVDTLDE